MTTGARRKEVLLQIRPFIEKASAFSGWTFDVQTRVIGDPPPWDYEALARERVRDARRVLDLGTGGGEVLSRIVEGTGAEVVATEEWHVNAPIARDRLRPLGVAVARADSLRLPFRDRAFDLVLNRHEALEPAEVARVLHPGGIMLTQQVGDEQFRELRQFFPRRTVWPDHYNGYQQAFRDLGFTVTAQAHDYRVAYRSLGDVVYMMIITPWEMEDFDPIREIDDLIALEDAYGTEDGIVLTESRYLLEARK